MKQVKKWNLLCQKAGKLLLILAAVIWLCGNTEAATVNEKTTFSFFTETMGLSPAAACGVMANIKCESGFQPEITGGGGSYGICQWTGVRKSRLQNWCSTNGYAYSSLKGQLHYLQYELKTYFPNVVNYLKTVGNTSSGAYHAAFYFCYYFEIPANTYNTSVYRGKLAQSTYWKELGESSIYLSAQTSGNGIQLTWNGSSNYAYSIMRAQKSGGTYEKIAVVKAGAKRIYKDETAKVGKKYYYYLIPMKKNGTALTASNKVSAVRKASLADSVCRITLSQSSYVFNNKAKKPKITVQYDGKMLKEGSHYTVTYTNNKNAGTAAVTIKGKGSYVGNCRRSFVIQKAAQKIAVSDQKLVQKSGTAALKVSAKGKVTLKSADPKIVAIKKGKLLLKTPGIAKITVTASAAKNWKAASKQITVTVLPAKPVITKGSTKGNTVTLKWKKGKGVDGYQVQYTDNGKFTSTSLKKEVADPSCRIENLKKGKSYSFRVRSYTKIGEKRLYSSWSKKKTIKLKK